MLMSIILSTYFLGKKTTSRKSVSFPILNSLCSAALQIVTINYYSGNINKLLISLIF